MRTPINTCAIALVSTLVSALPLLADGPRPLRLVAPGEGATVPLLSDGQKGFLDRPQAERVKAFADAAFRRDLRDCGHYPAKVRLEWTCDELPGGVRPVFSVAVYRLPERTPVFRADTVGTHVELDNLEIARDYEWTVHANALSSAHASGTFRTEDRAPRLIRAPDVPNVRDLGGRIGLDGRRVRQGLVFRSAGLNDNAYQDYSTREETLARAKDPEALLAQEAALKAELGRFRALQAEPAGLRLLYAPLSPAWTVFRVAMDEAEFRAQCPAALRALRDIPPEFLGAAAESATLDARGVFDFPEDARRHAKGPAVFLQALDFDEDGWISLGCGADWWWALLVDGEIVFDRTAYNGNNRNPVGPGNHVFLVPVHKGRNLFAAVVAAGSAGWRWSCRSAPAEPVATLLAGNVKNLGRRIEDLFRVKKGVKPGKTRISDKNRALFLETLGIRSDIDLRTDNECHGMEGSPLGPTVTWYHISSSAYAGMQSEGGKKQFAKVFRIFLDPANYPIDFHCIAGQDRTGAVAFIVNALLGVAEEELFLDWEATGFWNPDPDFNHQRRFDKLYAGFDDFPGGTINARVEAYVLSLGFTPEDIATLRSILLEP